MIPRTSTDWCIHKHFCSPSGPPLQVLSQRNALLSSTLASLWLRGWWNSLSRSLVAGSIGPKFLSAARRVLSIGRLVSAASACADSGPARGRRGATVASVRGEVRSRSFLQILMSTYPHWENQTLYWWSLWGWLHSPPAAAPESAPSGTQSSSPGGRLCTSRDSASPARADTSSHVINMVHPAQHCFFSWCCFSIHF